MASPFQKINALPIIAFSGGPGHLGDLPSILPQFSRFPTRTPAAGGFLPGGLGGSFSFDAFQQLRRGFVRGVLGNKLTLKCFP
ncbi:MAG: hypothetical protein JRI66_11885 [Deltaproteobacteria bacterium]|nr:hypothetical protein [Deltaproteobacteria bacterium]